MTGIDPDWTTRQRDWAAEQLGLAVNAPLAKVREHFLRRLPTDEFVPATEERQALIVLLLGRGLPESRQAEVDHAIAQADAERLLPEVENFAAHFWNLSPPDRRKRWNELLNQCATVPALHRRLHALEAGLDHVPGSEGEKDWRVLELERQVREVFVLSPARQARARQAFLAGIEDGSVWKPAVRRLRSSSPLLASLAPDLLEKVLTANHKPIRLPKSAPPKEFWPDILYIAKEFRPVLLCVAIAICFLLVKALTHSNTTSSYSKPAHLSPNEELMKWNDELSKDGIMWEGATKRLFGDAIDPVLLGKDHDNKQLPGEDKAKDPRFP